MKILIVDDHPAMIEGYKTILSYSNYTLEYDTALNCKDAYYKIVGEKRDFYDFIFLDISLPSFNENKIESGVDLAILVRNEVPTSKLIILTSHVDSLLLYSIAKDIKPDGLLVKSDFSAQEMIFHFEEILSGKFVITSTVEDSIEKINGKDFYLDSVNRQIITLLGKGVQTKRIPEILNLSLSAIDKRKVVIKDFLGILKGNDEDIIREAKVKGLI